MTVLALTGVFVAGVLYALGVRRQQGSRARRERGRRSEAFYVGLAAAAIAVSPPLDDLADGLFWAHMAAPSEVPAASSTEQVRLTFSSWTPTPSRSACWAA